METKIGDFFIKYNSVYNITDEDYKNVNILINTAKAFARNINQSVCVIDYFRQDFLYVSENMPYLCGQIVETINDLDNRFYIDCITENERNIIIEINKKGFEFFYELPSMERVSYTLSFDFHIKNGRTSRLVSRSLTPIALTKDGKIWLALCIISISPRSTPGNVIMRKFDSGSYFELSHERTNWIKKHSTKLTDIERDIIILSSQGYTMDEIADKLYRSINTIKACKRSLFAKMNVKNITEALSFAIKYKLL